MLRVYPLESGWRNLIGIIVLVVPAIFAGVFGARLVRAAIHNRLTELAITDDAVTLRQGGVVREIATKDIAGTGDGAIDLVGGEQVAVP